jgi:Glycosyl hydrolase catalytic core/F5/8 type C domain
MTHRPPRRSHIRAAVVSAFLMPLAFGCSTGVTGSATRHEQAPEPVASQTNDLLAGTATASSIQSSPYPASYAVDNNFSTRWSSQWSDPQWLQIDFGAVQAINRVTLYWENAYGSEYQIQVSNDATTWTTITTVTNGTGGTNDFPGLSASGRYVRMYGTRRGTQYGYSLWEFQVNAGASASDAGTDARSDAGSDATADAAGDASIDAKAETGSDATGDAASDAGNDAQADTGSDAGGAGSCKRGLGYGYDSVADLTALANGGKGISWWYNWSLVPDQGVGSAYTSIGVDFVPMQWGGNFTASGDLPQIPGAASWLLAFNEPEDANQANLTPQQAAALWPQLEQIASSHNPKLKLASPAVNYCGGNCNETSPFTWLDQFFAACANCQVDAIAVHWYSCSASDLQGYIHGTGSSPAMTKYNKPIWLTEFAMLGSGCATTEAAASSYLSAALPYLESEPAVARYAWFTGRSASSPWINLLGASGQLTALGEQYVTAPQSCGSSGSAGETALSRAGWVASASNTSGTDVPSNALDGNTATRWSTGAAMNNGMWFEVDMAASQTFDEITIDAASSTNDYARGYQVFVSADGTNFGSAIATGTGGAALITVQFPTQSARYIKVVQTGAASDWWSIAELNVYRQ